MKMTLKSATFLAVSSAFLFFAAATAFEPPAGNDAGAESETSDVAIPSTIAEARARAVLLHETIRGTLQIMHRDFFDEDEPGSIPSASMEDVFHELSRSHGVTVKWLVVNTDVVNVDHRPADEFEKAAAKALAKGKERFERNEDADTPGESRYRYAGPIRLQSQCLKCHVKRRTSNEERVAGLAISMPLTSGNTGDAE